MRVAFIFGTRPEAIKLAPVIAEARRRSATVESLLVTTGQHREMLGAIFDLFEIKPDIDLQLMVPGQGLPDLTARTIGAVTAMLREQKPDLVVVQGDTTTAMATAMAAFYERIPVAHVEAGLRTDRLDAPFPEEFNRRVIGQLAAVHFAPTIKAEAALVRDAIPALGGRIIVTGNTVIDALHFAAARSKQRPSNNADVVAAQNWKLTNGQRVILVTGHRRESFGAPFRDFCHALRDIAAAHADVMLVYPVHLNPNVQKPVRELLDGVTNLVLAPVMDYPDFVALMSLCDLVITDSGGVQEEAPALGKPVIVTRDVTERPEAVEAGGVILTGTNRDRIVIEVNRLLNDEAHYYKMAQARSPYGDGRAAIRIMDELELRFSAGSN